MFFKLIKSSIINVNVNVVESVVKRIVKIINLRIRYGKLMFNGKIIRFK